MGDTNFEPGAAQYGNFINYYQFNPVIERVNLIPPNFLKSYKRGYQRAVGLDIGCNSGDLTISLFNHFNKENSESLDLHILGVDLDPVLIQRAKEQNPYPQCINFLQLDFAKSDELQVLPTYLKKFDKLKFDFITCFSVTMWIHLNHGDSGLLAFLKKVSTLTDCLVLEPQPWKCYKTASRRMRTLKQSLFQDIHNFSIRQNVVQDITEVLKSNEMELVQNCGQTKWKRPIFIFQRK